MRTAILYDPLSHKEMIKLNFLASMFNPKFLAGLFFLDMTGIMDFISKYIFQDLTYLKFLVIACAIDLITGVTKVWVNEGSKAITSKGLRDSVSKVIQYGSFLIITHVLTHYQIDGKANTDFLWINKIAFEFLILVEIKSVYENIIKINSKLDFVSEILSKISELQKTKKDGNNSVK